MKALILAGGFGTRLRPLSCTRPKILFPIVNRPLLDWTLERLSKKGVNEVVMAVSHRTEPYIRQSRIRKYGMTIRFSRDPLKKPLGTGGPIKKAEKLIGHEEPFFVLNEDVFAHVDCKKILRMHQEKKAVATIALHEVEDPSRYGVAELTGDCQVKRFVEKPPLGSAPTKLINAGVYALSPRIFEYIPKDKSVSIEREVFPQLAKEGILYGYVFNGLWTDIGKTEDYLAINRIMLESLANTGVKKPKIADRVQIKQPVALDTGVTLGEESIIGPYAVLGQNVKVGKNVIIKNSVLFPHVEVGDTSTIDEAIIGEGTMIGRCVKIGKHCMIGDGVKIRDNLSLADGVSICSAKEITVSVSTPNRVC